MSGQETSGTGQPGGSDIRLQFTLHQAPTSDLPYVKVDLVQLCYVGSQFAISFHQIDYQDTANAIVAMKANTNPSKTIHGRAVLVSRVVMDREAFIRALGDLKEVCQQAGITWP